MLKQMDAEMATRRKPGFVPAQVETERRFLEHLAARLAKTPRKEVFIYVHGFDNTFEDAVRTAGEMWHFLGREGVPICYTWPAGVGGIFGYEYTLVSTQFTVYHFKQTLRLIASCPEVEKVHIIAHSRGTAVTVAPSGQRNAEQQYRKAAQCTAQDELDGPSALSPIRSHRAGGSVLVFDYVGNRRHGQHR